jgi:uncharacterized coiled-coil DUF342 family protein
MRTYMMSYVNTKPSEWSPSSEETDEFNKRDERVKSAVLAAIEDAWEESRILEDRAKEMRDYARKLKEACAKEQWWELKGVVSKADVESLCDVSPSNLLDD